MTAAGGATAPVPGHERHRRRETPLSGFGLLLKLVHLVGLALAVGSATVKLALLYGCVADVGFTRTYLGVIRPITRLLVLGLILLTLSGVGWLLLGYSLTRLLVMKLILVAAIWVLGPIIDNVAEPKFRELAPQAGEPATPAFLLARNRYVTLEVAATGAFYVIVVMWVLL